MELAGFCAYISPHSAASDYAKMQQVRTDDSDRCPWTVASPRRHVFDLAERQHSLDDLTHVLVQSNFSISYLAKDNMFPIQELCWLCRDKELAPVGIRSRVGLQRVSFVGKEAMLRTMLRRPGASCFCAKFSSSNFVP